ncbi:MAG: transcription elongation factor GreA [Candidatus Magasanikbacteria bacterium]|nr:transcription elongation factor GreA [Candidatus Magasanikbacteria bacterium]
MPEERIQYLTPQGLEDLKKELENLKNFKIPDIANRIDEAKQHGDLSENAEYHQAKEEMAWAQGRRQEVEYLIDHSEVMVAPTQKQVMVGVGSTIIVKTNNKTKTYTIVGPQEVDPLQGKISNESPLGMSFIGHKVGDELSINTPAGKQIYEILELK